MESCPRISLEDFKIIEKIGEGAFAAVFLAIFKPTGDRVALKRMRKENFDERVIDRFHREIRILRKISHPSIARFYGSFENESSIFIVMEYISGITLSDIIRCTSGYIHDLHDSTEFTEENNSTVQGKLGGALNEKLAIKYFIELLCILKSLHDDFKVVHRDVKLDNILIDVSGRVRILDFGLSNFDEQTENPLCENIMFETACGTVGYAAPEMIKHEAYTEKVDVWAAGVVLYAMVTGNLPFFSENMTEVCRMIVEDDVILPSHVSQGLNDLLSALLTKSPKLRPALGDVLRFPIIAEALKEHHNICSFLLHPPEIECTISLHQTEADDKKEIFESCFRKEVVSRIKNHIRFQEKSDFYKCLNSSKSVQQISSAQTLKVNPKMPILRFSSGRQRFFTLTPPPQHPSQLAAQQSFKPKALLVNSKATPILNNTPILRPQLRQVAI